MHVFVSRPPGLKRAYAVTGIGMVDALGAIGIAVFSYREGKEAFEKAKGSLACSCQGKCEER